MYYKTTYSKTREKGRILTQSYDKILYTYRKNPNINATIQKRRQNLDNAIADRLLTVNWRNNSHLTGVVKPVYWYPAFPLTATAV